MVRSIIFMLGLTFAFSTLSGQDLLDQIPTEGRLAERIKSMKIGFITENLGLTPEQSQKFWPVYNDFERKSKAVRKKYQPNKRINLMSDAEVEQHLENHFKMEAEALELKRQCFETYKEFLSVRQIANLAKVEREFKKNLLRELNNRRQQNGRNNGKN